MENYKNIKISDLDIKPRGVRTRHMDEGIDTLAEHIKVHGLLNPLVVTENDDGKYEIISGERRFKAIRGLNWSEIPCHIVSVTDEYDKNAIRLGEQLTSSTLQWEYVVDLCATLYNRYRDIDLVSKKTGISKKLIERYVQYARLPSLVQDNLDAITKNPKTAVNLAVEAADALAWSKDSDVPAEKVLKLAQKLGEKKKKSQEDYKKLKQAAEENPESSLEEIESESKKIKNPKLYKIILPASASDKLESLAKRNGNDPEDELIEQISRAIEMIDDND
jgi:ParB family chromosome partitioning protein